MCRLKRRNTKFPLFIAKAREKVGVFGRSRKFGWWIVWVKRKSGIRESGVISEVSDVSSFVDVQED